jgi:hemoglobin
LQAELPPELAQSWSALAHRIGRGLRLGIEGVTNDGPPRLD